MNRFGLISRYPLVVAAVIAALQSAAILYVVESRASVLRHGQEVLLQTAPIDPRDLLRGDYVVLSYDIAEIPTSLVFGSWPQGEKRQAIHVRIAPGEGGLWKVMQASFDPLPPVEGTVLLKGTVSYVPDRSTGADLRVAYGIERYYVPEGEGRDIESARNEGRVSVAARVSAAGKASIRALMLDGKPLYEEPLY